MELRLTMEHAIGTEITLKVVEGKDDKCDGCFFTNAKVGCEKPDEWKCSCFSRTDHKNVIYKEIKEN